MSVARLQVSITDVNDKAPRFVGLDVNGLYPAAVSDYTQRGDEVIFVSAIDLDTTAPNNVVSDACDVSWAAVAGWPRNMSALGRRFSL